MQPVLFRLFTNKRREFFIIIVYFVPIFQVLILQDTDVTYLRFTDCCEFAIKNKTYDILRL